MEVGVMRITPREAKNWLEANKGNRPLNRGHVQRLAAAIEAGEWELNGDPIRFDEDGCLLDGQHRLHAIVEADKAVDSVIIRNLPASTFSTMDCGRRRGGADTLAVAGETNCVALAAACRCLLLYENSGVAAVSNSKRQFSNAQILDCLQRHPDIRESLQVHHKLHSRFSFAPFITIDYLFRKKHPGHDYAGFWDRVASGEMIARGDPEYALRERLQTNATSSAKLPSYQLAALAIRALHAYISRQELRLLRGISSLEDFPKI